LNTAKEHYLEFLGIDENKVMDGEVVFSSEFRDLPLNQNYFYPIIATEYFGGYIYSTSDKHYSMVKELVSVHGDNIENFYEAFNVNNNEYRLRKMYRYSYDDKTLHDTRSRTMTFEDIKYIGVKTDEEHEQYIKRKKEVLEAGRQFIIEEKGKIKAIGLISEIRCGGGNIVVATMKGYRGNGYAKEVVKGCINWCIEHDVIPVYLVEDTNEISKKIPLSLGFNFITTEWIISE